MRFNKKAVQKELDKTAEELEQNGFMDLANKVDEYNKKLMEASTAEEVQQIRKVFINIDREAQRRLKGNSAPEDDKARNIRRLKARAALRRARRVAERKKALADRKETNSKAKTPVTPRSERVARLLEDRKAKKVSTGNAERFCPYCGAEKE